MQYAPARTKPGTNCLAHTVPEYVPCWQALRTLAMCTDAYCVDGVYGAPTSGAGVARLHCALEHHTLARSAAGHLALAIARWQVAIRPTAPRGTLCKCTLRASAYCTLAHTTRQCSLFTSPDHAQVHITLWSIPGAKSHRAPALIALTEHTAPQKCAPVHTRRGWLCASYDYSHRTPVFIASALIKGIVTCDSSHNASVCSSLFHV